MIDISKINEHLYVGSRMGHEHVDELKVLKFDFIISMIAESRLEDVYTKPPFRAMWLRTHDNFLRPISNKKFLQGVEAALPVIKSGGKVLVFCMLGRRRSVAMASAILMAQGHTAHEAAQMVTSGRKIADPYMWYIWLQIKSFERYWKKRNPVTSQSKEPA